MVVSYDKLWRLLAQRKLNKRDLVRLSGISISTIRSMEKCNNVNLDVLKRICETLHVGIGDVMEFVEE